ncbi:MAG: RtcB family protein [Thaumarchaeota archaeon]|nr:RtcB family protein [Nitrososphaerota archaeon]
MNVPARIYATKKLLEGMDQGVFEQVTNVAALPGIERYSYAMADAHWGYGFPIGGVAAFDPEKGVISPGGIGFDINCLHPDARVLDANGAWHKIEDLGRGRYVMSLDFASKKAVSAGTLLFMRRREEGSLIRIRTDLNNEIKVTKDHPVLTARGMVLAGALTQTDSIVITGFSGVEFASAAHEPIVQEADLQRAMDEMKITDRGNARGQTMKHLRELKLDSVFYDSPSLPRLLKLLGQIFGDATIPRTKGGKYTTFYGRKEDLASMKEDVEALGFQASLHERDRHHHFETGYGISDFDFKEFSLAVNSTSFCVLVVALGGPYGKKTASPYRVPSFVMKAPKWQKRLFLASFLAAELGKPRTNNGFNFDTLSFSQSKLVAIQESAIIFLRDIRELLFCFGVEAAEPVPVEGYRYDGVDGQTIGFRLAIDAGEANMKKFFSQVGYLYNLEKERLASLASLYIDFLAAIRVERNNARNEASQMYAAGAAPSQIVSALKSKYVGESFIKHSIWSPRGKARVWDVERFEEFSGHREYGRGGFALGQIITIDEVPYAGFVYDLSLDHRDHNFIADGIVVSNCGMRLIRTNLRIKEVKPKVKELVDLLFRLVPTGVGVKGTVRVNQSQFEEVMRWGVKWCGENGYGWSDDADMVEEGGFLKGADPTKVSRQASSRGISQLGTLGSGNHYLEIQVIDPSRFFDAETGKHFGLVHDDQVVIMIHCGSRGFGHQIGSDYLRIFDGAMKRYGITVKDRELSCAPFSSKEGTDYYGAMVCAANMAFANRQVIVHRVREAFKTVFHEDAEALDMHIIYDVCHNIAKVERQELDGSSKDLVVHRKGATRSFGPGHRDIPAPYRAIGQPVIIGGSMETGSYLLLGTAKAMTETFGSTAHGSGRTMSRTAAKKQVNGGELQKSMEKRGIYVKAATYDGLAEEAGMAYKDISEVVDTMDRAGISKKVAALRPIGNIKG